MSNSGDRFLRIGIDLGGTKIEGVALEGSREVARLRVDTPRDDYDRTVDAIVGVVSELERRTASKGTVGVGSPGRCRGPRASSRMQTLSGSSADLF